MPTQCLLEKMQVYEFFISTRCPQNPQNPQNPQMGAQNYAPKTPKTPRRGFGWGNVRKKFKQTFCLKRSFESDGGAGDLNGCLIVHITRFVTRYNNKFFCLALSACYSFITHNEEGKRMNTVKLVWNGCDEYIELSKAEDYGYKIQGELIGKTEVHKAFDAVPCTLADIPLDEDGERDFDGFTMTETGNYYRII